MKILLLTTGAKTPVNVIDNALDLSGFSEPTLSILQTAFDQGNYTVIPDPEPIVEPVVLNWDGLYQGLMISDVYYYLAVVLGQQYSGIDGALDKTIDAIQYGIFKPDSVAAFPAFQSAINLLLYVLSEAGQSLSVEHLVSVRAVLDANGFQEIMLG